ncbi:MAG: hypothetical protein KC432_14990 [Thermomicrobiales bacterium]|nr:hypothetical protein [Thermomicrobiales bacterium]
MTSMDRQRLRLAGWLILFAAFGLFAAWRMQAFNLTSPVAMPTGVTWLPNTFATVDHPFHVARAAALWRELEQGHILRWVGQHQGGYPVEFYPLGEAWLEVVIRAASFGRLDPEGAHTLAIVALFLAPGAGFLALGRLDSLSPAVALLALALQLALPGGWYHGGYTELVQWGLVTNVAGATAAFLLLPSLIWFCQTGRWRAFASSTFLAALAVYSNPRSLIGVAAVALGCFVAMTASGAGSTRARVVRRITLVAVGAALVAAPLLVSLLRFSGLYTFVHYSGYPDLAAYLQASLEAVTPWVIGLALAGGAGAMVAGASSPAIPRRLATRGAFLALLVYVAMTLALSFVPTLEAAAAQLETTRLMPLQRLLTLYLAAAGVWWLALAIVRRWTWLAEAGMAAAAIVVVAALTRPPQTQLDPAAPAIPPSGLYPVTMSAQPIQANLRQAIAIADAAAAPGTALLVLGSGLSWHQGLWAPLWTDRPLYYDNWLWSWRPDRVGTPGYQPEAGNHYPDPERTLTRGYFAAHGIGGVVVTGQAAAAAAGSPLLEPLGGRDYRVYIVRDPQTIITFDGTNATQSTFTNQLITAQSDVAAQMAEVRVNWFPRWQGSGTDEHVSVGRASDGSLALSAPSPTPAVRLTYAVQPLDWLARALALGGMLLVMFYPLAVPLRARGRYHVASRERSAANS